MSTCTASAAPLRRATAGVALLLALAACVTPRGAEVPECDPSWEPMVVAGASHVTGAVETISIECYRVIAEQRLEVGVLMPPGPECYAVNAVEVIEDDDAISLEVRIGTIRNPLGGACPPDASSWGIPVELNGRAEGRRVLDASRPVD